MCGRDAGANNLTSKTNAQVAAFYVSLLKKTGGATGHQLDAQVLATALAAYVTNQTLAATIATAYGFTVTASGWKRNHVRLGQCQSCRVRLSLRKAPS